MIIELILQVQLLLGYVTWHMISTRAKFSFRPRRETT